MTLTGYPPEDLVLRESFARASEQARGRPGRARSPSRGWATSPSSSGTWRTPRAAGRRRSTDAPTDADDRPGDANPRRGAPRNAAALLHGGEVVVRYYKRHLPNYGVFDEARYFVPGTELPIVRLHGVDVALTICEDLWVEGGPCGVRRPGRGRPRRLPQRLALRAGQGRRCGCRWCAAAPPRRTRRSLYCNQVGGQDELVFDGDSHGGRPPTASCWPAPRSSSSTCSPSTSRSTRSAVAERREGRIGPMTVTRHVLSDEPVRGASSRGRAPWPSRSSDCEEVWRALVLGLRDFIDKNGMPSVVLGLSGGIDSALVAALAVDALGADRVHGVGLPSKYSSEHSLSDAEDSAKRLGLHYSVVPIAPMVEAFDGVGRAVRGGRGEPAGPGARHAADGAVEPARPPAAGHQQQERGGGRLLDPLRRRGRRVRPDQGRAQDAGLGAGPLAQRGTPRDRGETEPIPQNSIDKPPSAELAPGQQDSDSLPSYEELDAVIADYVDRDLGMAELLERGHDPEVVARVLRLVDTAEFKRRQSAPGHEDLA